MAKAQLKETTNMDEKRIWIVKTPTPTGLSNKTSFVFFSKAEARKFKKLYDAGVCVG